MPKSRAGMARHANFRLRGARPMPRRSILLFLRHEFALELEIPLNAASSAANSEDPTTSDVDVANK
jgi:hypothetical protein